VLLTTVLRAAAHSSLEKEKVLLMSGFAISPMFEVGARGVFTRRDFSPSFRVDGDVDFLAIQLRHS
jgi:hypothetical protein